MNYQVYAGAQYIGQTNLEMKDEGMSVYMGLFVPLPAYDVFRPLFQSYLDCDTKGIAKDPQLDAFFQKLESLCLSIQKEDGMKIPTSWIQIFDYSAHIPGDNELEIHAQVTDRSKL